MQLNIKELVDKKFPNKSQFAKAIEIGYPAACKLYEGDVSKINFDTLEKICNVLDCTPNDVFLMDDTSSLHSYSLNQLKNKFDTKTIDTLNDFEKIMSSITHNDKSYDDINGLQLKYRFLKDNDGNEMIVPYFSKIHQNDSE